MIKIASCYNFSTDEQRRFDAALDLANKVMASDDFKLAVLAAQFTFTHDTPTEIYQRLTGQDWQVRFQIVTPPWYKRWFSKEVAREDSTGMVTLDRNKFGGEDLASLSNTLAHEVTHCASYTHPFSDVAGREQSVPYQVGSIVEQIARGLV